MSISDRDQPLHARMTMGFHLPFYTFRKQPCTDNRHDHEGNPLRKSWKLPSMQMPGQSQPSPESDGHICESQVSTVVSVVDTQGWTAYAFEDTYYKARDSSQESDIFCSTPGFYFPDALTGGDFDSTRFLESREYFLRVFQTRIDQAYQEWRTLVHILEQTVKRQVKRLLLSGDIVHAPPKCSDLELAS